MTGIREERESDLAEIRRINEAAFNGETEANLIELLRRNGKIDLSLVAEIDGNTVGHILFSPVFIEGGPESGRGTALAPVAVVPGHQKKGVGSQLIREGLKRCRSLGIDYAIVLGNPDYYSRFGFQPIKRYNLTSSYGDGPHTMVCELSDKALHDLSGKICYQPEFKEAGC